MLNTATITFHAAHNYGSMLQAFALQQSILRMGADNHIINLRTPAQKRLYQSNRFKKMSFPKNIIFKLFYSRYFNQFDTKYRLFEQFQKDYLILTPGYSSLKELNEANLNFDCYIAGSDQIWNTAPFDFDWSYFLPFVKAGRKISYAASMGPYAKKQITQKELISKYLSSFDAISVREEETAKIVRQLTNKKIRTDLDPTLLLSAKEWSQYINEKPIIQDDYIFVYVPHFDKQTFDIAAFLGKSLKMPVIESTRVIGFRSPKYRNIHYSFETGPLEFLNLLKNSRLTVCGSFHAVLFSTLFKKPFFAVNGKNDNRMNDFLTNTELSSQCVDKTCDIKEKIRRIFDCGFDTAEKYITAKRSESIEYLRNAIMTK